MRKVMLQILMLTIAFSIFAPPYTVNAKEPEQIAEVYQSNSSVLIGEPRADVIKWRYKTENGILYKRLYNYTKVKWVGDWIRCY